ncbi:MAG: IclR family transcriptional regulator [Anaerolineae bacterium]
MDIKSIDRAMQILFAFSIEDRLLGVTELSERLNLNSSTIHHLAASLKKWGLLEQDPVSRKYRLGVRLIELGGTMLQSRALARAIQPYLYHVAENIKETAYLGVLVGGELLNLEQECGPHLIQYAGWQGRRTPFHCTSAGKMLAAHLPTADLDILLDKYPLTAYTSKTITDPDILLQDLAEIKARGYSMSMGELDDNLNAIAVPVKRIGKSDGRIIAAIGVAGPAYRFTPEVCEGAAAFLKSVGQEVSSKVSTEDFTFLSA